MNRELKDLAVIIDRLPKNISYFSFFADNETGEFIQSCNTRGEDPYRNISNLYKQQIEDGVYDNQMGIFVSNLYAMFFALSQNEGYEVLSEMKNAINEIINNYGTL